MIYEYDGLPFYKNEEAPYAAAKAGNRDAVANFINSMQFNWVDVPDEKGNTLLFYAGKYGHVEIVTLLLKEGASPYINKKGKSLFDKAKEEVKVVLEEYLCNKARSFEEVYSDHLKEVAEDFASRVPERLLSIVTTLPEECKNSVAQSVTRALLSIGEVELAESVRDLYQNERYKHLLGLIIEEFSLLLPETNDFFANNRSTFHLIFKRDLEFVRMNQEIPEDVKQQIVNGIFEAENCAKMVEFVRSIEDPSYRQLARVLLGFSIFDELVRKAENRAIKKCCEQEKDWVSDFENLLENAVMSKDYEEVFDYLYKMEILDFRTWAFVVTAQAMCKNEKVEEGYQLISVAAVAGFIDLTKFADLLQDLMEELSENIWVEKFTQLMNQHTDGQSWSFFSFDT